MEDDTQADIDSAAEAQQQQSERRHLGEMHWWPEYYDRMLAERKADDAKLEHLCRALDLLFPK